MDKGVGWVHAEIDKLRQRGRVSPDAARRLTAQVSGSVSTDALADADLVIEAVFEEMKVKQQVFTELEQVVAPTAVLATNTSSLSVSEMSASLQHPERVVGMHFFNPVAVMPLLEVVRAEHTDDATLATAFSVGATLKKSCVLVTDAPAFVVNRLLTRFLGEVTAAVDEGTPIEVADEALAPLGLPMAPFVLLQLVGPAIALHTAETLHEAFPDRFAVSDNLRRLVAAGKSGIYRWDNGQRVDPDVAALFEQGDQPSRPDEVRDRALSRTGAGDPTHARRGRRRRAAGHRPLPAPGCRLAVPPGRHHALPRPHRDLGAGHRSPLLAAGTGAWRPQSKAKVRLA